MKTKDKKSNKPPKAKSLMPNRTLQAKELLEKVIISQFPGIICFSTTLENVSFKYTYRLVVEDFKEVILI